MGDIYFTSDTHFNQQRTLEMSKRPFNNVKEMNNVLVSNWNNIIKPGDTVYHLGDFGDYRVREFLNGEIIMIKGNYERSGFKEEFEKYKHYFKEIHELYHAIILEGYNIKMTHEPHRLKESPIDDKHINIWGHVHKLCMIKSYGINVGADCHHFKPINLETILFYHNAILNYYDKDVFY
jgi:calcineurin-like phosphoesterase family protein